ncbi:MAG: MFS transporter [Sphingomicrobium sp.]
MLARGAGALANREFRIYTIGNGLSSVGLWVQRLAIAWLAWDLSHSSLWVGLIAFSLFGPVLFLSPLFGVLVDRLEPIRTSAIINGLMAGWATLLALLSLAGLLNVQLLFAVTMMIGVTSAAYAPIRISIIPSLVPREMVPSAIGISSTIFNASRLIGPAIAGALLVTLPIASAFLVNAISYGPLIYALAIAPSRPVAQRAREPFFGQLAEGFAYAASHPFIRLQLLLTAWNGLFGRSILEMLPVYSDRLYSAGTNGLAILSAVAGAGALAAAFGASRLHLNSRQLQIGSVVLSGLNAIALLTLPISDSFWVGLPCIAVIGFGATGSAVLSQTLVQMEVEDRVRGRISSLWGMAGLGGSAFGGLLLGAALGILSVPAATFASACIALIAPALALGSIRRSRSDVHWPKPDAEQPFPEVD